MKRFETVKSKRDFDYIIKKGKKYQNNFFSIFELENENNTILFGIGVSKKLGNAVFRNKKKRQIRQIIDKTKKKFKKGYNYIIILKEEGTKISFKNLEKEMIVLLNEVEDE